LYRNSKCSSDRHKDIYLTEGGLGVGNDTEKSAEVIVLIRKRAPKAFGEVSREKEGLNLVSSTGQAVE